MSNITVLATEKEPGLIHLNTTWTGQYAHVVRKHGVLRRCRVGKLNISDGEVAIFVEFREKLPSSKEITWVRKTVSPLLLLIANEHWKMATAVSEDETTQACETGCPGRDYDNQQQASLPLFECKDQAMIQLLTQQERRKLAWMTVQVNNCQSLSQLVMAPSFDD